MERYDCGRPHLGRVMDCGKGRAKFHDDLYNNDITYSTTTMTCPEPPSQTFHPPGILPAVPVVESVVGGAHYAGVRVDTLNHREQRRPSEGSTDHQAILDDLEELYCCRPTTEIFRRSWHSDAEFEDPLSKCKGYSEYAAQWFAMVSLTGHSSSSHTLAAQTVQQVSSVRKTSDVVHRESTRLLPETGLHVQTDWPYKGP